RAPAGGCPVLVHDRGLRRRRQSDRSGRWPDPPHLLPGRDRHALSLAASLPMLVVGGADERGLAEAARTSPDAFAVLYRRYVARVHAFAYRRSGSREVAEEVTSATFERAWRAMPSFQWRGGGFSAWLFAIAARELAGWYRRTARHGNERAQRALRLF